MWGDSILEVPKKKFHCRKIHTKPNATFAYLILENNQMVALQEFIRFNMQTLRFSSANFTRKKPNQNQGLNCE